ncbi:matrin 3-like 1.1 isoform 2-T4 [Acanthopagrus schlegelii]
MSHNYPYRRPPLDSDLRPGPYSSSDRHHAPPDHDFYRPPQESCSSSFPSSSSSSSRGVQWSQDGALSILSSCGLEPADLALLAKLPEDVLNVESLPHVLQQIKGKRGPIAPLAPSALSSSSSSCSSYPRSSAGLPAVNLSATDWDHHRSPPLQCLLDQVTSPLSSDLDRWGNPRTTGSVRLHPPSSSSSGSVVDYHHRLGPSEYGSADHRSAPPLEQLHQKPRGGRHQSETSSMRSSSRPAANMPSELEALDFQGTTPPWYPYSCSLCDITVMSERVWIKHINGAQHADGQLGLLQRFPNWDCRMETVGRTDNQSEKRKDEDKPGQQPQTANQDSKLPADKKSPKKTSDKGKVVCVKFPANSVDEAYLRKLTEPFGKIVKIIMFPSLAFVELGSIDQAKDLVKFHFNYPPTVNGQQMEFRISNTFTFLQSSRVVSFAPAPTEENGQSDLMSVVKRFGSPLYTLFLPSMAFVEMKNTPDAQKLVDYYSSNTLRINNDSIKVSFSGEYKSLMRVASAKRYEEETTKITRSSSREKEDKITERKKRRTTDQEESSTRSRERSTKEKRSRSRERSTREENSRSRKRKTRTRSPEKSTEEKRSRSRERPTKKETESSRSTDKSSREERTRTRSKSREKSKNKFSIERRSRSKETFGRDKRTRTRSKSSEKSSSEKRSGSSVVTVKTELTVTESRTDPDPDPDPVRESKPEAEEKQQTEEEAESSAEESDIEGMEVIGEDDVETLDDAELEDEDDEAAEKNSPDEDKEEKVKDEEEKELDEEMVEKQEAISERGREEEQTSETAETQLEDDEEEPDLPVNLKNCITLDELGQEQTENRDEDDPDEPKSLSNRVIYFRNLPRHPYTDQEFLNLVKDFGTPVRYFHRTHCDGFIEMLTSTEAQRAVKELGIKHVTLKGSKLVVQMSTKYKRLSYEFSDALVVEEKGERRSWSSGRNERLNKDESNRKSEGREECSKKESTPEKTPEKESKSKKNQKKSKTASKNSSESRKSPEKESICKNTSEETSRAPENKSANKETSEKESVFRKSPEEESHDSSEKSCRTKTEEKDLTAEKTPETESLAETSEENKMSERKTDENNSVPGDNEESHKTEDKMEIEEEETPGPQTDQEPAADRPQQQSESAGGAAELQELTKPVGTEFVRPVVGYFCNLCQVIYADEEEAKQQHCSSLTHYRKYQEKTGKDPWTS